MDKNRIDEAEQREAHQGIENSDSDSLNGFVETN